MKLTKNADGTYTLERDTGSVTLTANEISFIVNESNRSGFRLSVEYIAREKDGETFNLSDYPYSFAELVDEVCESFEDETDYGNIPDDDDIETRIIDTIDSYNA